MSCQLEERGSGGAAFGPGEDEEAEGRTEGWINVGNRVRGRLAESQYNPERFIDLQSG